MVSKTHAERREGGQRCEESASGLHQIISLHIRIKYHASDIADHAQYIASNATLHIDITSHQWMSSLRKIPERERHQKIGVKRNGRQKCEDAKMSMEGREENVKTKGCLNKNGLLGASWHTNQLFQRRVSIGTCFPLPGLPRCILLKLMTWGG